jgi:hypothetical protein
VVHLRDHQRRLLYTLIPQGHMPARTVCRVPIRPPADDQRPVHTAEGMWQTSGVTVMPARNRCLSPGLEAVLYGRLRPGVRRTLAGSHKAHWVALVCRTPPAGRDRWRWRRFTTRVVEVGLVDDVASATVRRGPKNYMLKPW